MPKPLVPPTPLVPPNLALLPVDGSPSRSACAVTPQMQGRPPAEGATAQRPQRPEQVRPRTEGEPGGASRTHGR